MNPILYKKIVRELSYLIEIRKMLSVAQKKRKIYIRRKDINVPEYSGTDKRKIQSDMDEVRNKITWLNYCILLLRARLTGVMGEVPSNINSLLNTRSKELIKFKERLIKKLGDIRLEVDREEFAKEQEEKDKANDVVDAEIVDK